MDFEKLMDATRIQHGTHEEYLVSRDNWKQLWESGNDDGATWLMLASQDGNLECIDLLLKCGADLNAYDHNKRRAIDYAIDGNHLDAALLLFKWDSLLPNLTDEVRREKFIRLPEENVEIKILFEERDDFHQKVRNGETKSLEEDLEQLKPPTPRYWVDRNGHSALYTAAKEITCNSWALLKSKYFDYTDYERLKLVESEVIGKKKEFDLALEKYFIPVDDCHVYKMLIRSRVLGNVGGEFQRFKDIYEKVNEVSMTSLLLRCLQDVPHLEVIFETQRSDSLCTYGGAKRDNLYLTDHAKYRIYASTGKECKYSDVIANLVHELCHLAMHVVFKNNGLPYENDDTKNKERYDKIVSTVTCYDDNDKCDDIIRRANTLGKYFRGHELIACVPEIAIKYHVEQGDSGEVKYLQDRVPELLEYFLSHVVPVMEGYVAGNKVKNLMPRTEWLTFPELLNHHENEHVEFAEGIRAPKSCWHKSFRVHCVTSLQLGISHLKKLHGDLLCVDWRNYERSKEFFGSRLARGLIKNMAVIWDEGLETEFCRHFDSSDENLARSLQPYVNIITFIIPKAFGVLKEIEPFEYTWNDLSDKTKSWLLGKKMNFQGVPVTLGEMLEDAIGVGNMAGAMNSLLGTDGLSILMDQEGVDIGSPLKSISDDVRSDSSLTVCQALVPCSLRVRPLTIYEGQRKARACEIFIVAEAEKSRLEKDGITEAREWDWGDVPAGIRYFLLSKEEGPGNQEDLFDRVVDKLKVTMRQGTEGSTWHYVHFFRLVDDTYIHLHSVDLGASRILIIAEEPGRNRSHFFQMTARGVKESSPGKWVEVFESAFLDRELSKQKKFDLTSKEMLEDILFDLATGGRSKTLQREHLQLEKRFFKLFCRAAGKVNIFIDGFDEADHGCVKPSEPSMLMQVLQALIRETNVKIFLITGRNDYHSLEERFSTLSRHFIPCEGAETVKFFSSYWNASLSSMPLYDRTRKVEKIISFSESLCVPGDEREISDLIGRLKMLSEGGGSRDINFGVVAKKLVQVGETLCVGVMEYSERSLLILMLASMAFQENFNIEQSLSLSRLYEWYIGYNVDLSCRVAAEASKSAEASVTSSALKQLKKLSTLLFPKGKRIESKDGETLEIGQEEIYKDSVLESLQKLSAFLLLKDKEFKLNDKEIHKVITTSLVVRRQNEATFVHRTFAEYLFLVWVLRKSDNLEVTKELVTQVLLEEKFETVRDFLDRLLLSNYEIGSPGCVHDMRVWGTSVFSCSTFSSRREFMDTIQKCLFKSILECREGILRHLVEISGEYRADVLFGEADWNVKCLNLMSSNRSRRWNAFTFCGACAGGTIFKSEHARGLCGRNAGFMNGMFDETRKIRMEQLRFLTKLLVLAEKHGLTSSLNQLMKNEGLWWLCIDYKDFWKKQYGRLTFQMVLDFLSRNKSEFLDTLTTKLFAEDGKRMFVYAAAFALDVFDDFLYLIIDADDWTDKLLEEVNFAEAWTGIVHEHGADMVEHLWSYFKGKLTTQEKRKQFFQRKDINKCNALLSAFMNWKNEDVIPLVWDLASSVMDEEECKLFLKDSFDGVDMRFWFINQRLFGWLLELLKNSFLTVEEAYRLLLSRNLEQEYYLLNFHFRYSPSTFYEWQNIFTMEGTASREVLTHMKGHFQMLVPSCFELSEWNMDNADYIENIERDFQEMLPVVFLECPFANSIQRLEEECIHRFVHPETRNEVSAKIQPFQWKEFLVLLWRQTRLEAEIMGQGELLNRLKNEWGEIFRGFPLVTPVGGDVKADKTRALIIPYFFAILAQTLSKEEVSRILEVVQYESAFHHAADMNDLRAFQSLYDVACWSMGEDALWRVHSMMGGGDRTVLFNLQLRKM